MPVFCVGIEIALACSIVSFGSLSALLWNAAASFEKAARTEPARDDPAAAEDILKIELPRINAEIRIEAKVIFETGVCVILLDVLFIIYTDSSPKAAGDFRRD
jgi:hypothetical protein